MPLFFTHTHTFSLSFLFIDSAHYGDDSLEIAQADNDILDQSDLDERIMAAEARFSTSSIATSFFSSEYFEHPALYRVLFMGSTTKAKKNELLAKLSQGFVHVLDMPTGRRKPMMPFKELKHNAVLLNDEDLLSDICEDYGVSMIEADFTWSSTAVNYSPDAKKLLLQYAWNQCPNPRDLPSAWLEAEISPQNEFKGQMYPDKTPNGIDLCVYFYDGPTHDDPRTCEDLNTLCILRKLGIYVLPLTNTRDESISTHFAELLTRYKVRCLDLGNLEVGQEPSFFHQRQSSTADRISRLQGMECTQSNIPRVAPYQVVAVEQFCGIENKAVFKLLKRTRERQVIRDELKEELLSRHSKTVTMDNMPLPVVAKKRQTWMYMSAMLFLLASIGYAVIQQSASAPWEATFQVTENLTFTLATRNRTGHLAWSEEGVPLVWLNDHIPIPIQRHDQVGYYQLLTPSLENVPLLVFSVNTTDERVLYRQSNNQVFLLLNAPPVVDPVVDRAAAAAAAMNSTELGVSVQREEQEEDGGFFEECWKSVVFWANNPFDKLKLLVVQ